MDFGTKQCIIGTECKDLLEGMTKGDTQKTAFNAGILAFIVGPMGSVSYAKNMCSFASSGVGVLNLAAVLSFHYGTRDGTISASGGSKTGYNDDCMNHGSSLTLNEKDEDASASADGGKRKKKGKKSLQ